MKQLKTQKEENDRSILSKDSTLGLQAMQPRAAGSAGIRIESAERPLERWDHDQACGIGYCKFGCGLEEKSMSRSPIQILAEKLHGKPLPPEWAALLKGVCTGDFGELVDPPVIRRSPGPADFAHPPGEHCIGDCVTGHTLWRACELLERHGYTVK